MTATPNRYRVLARLGAGGFGTVYRARMLGAYDFQRDVALKLLEEEKADEEILARFRDEARLLGRIRHPNIPSVGPPVRLDVGWAVAMDLVPGVDCGRLLKKAGPMPLSIALETTAVVAQTLHDLYVWKDLDETEQLKLIHRDIKPSNIMITSRGDVRLLDFGSAWASFEARESITTTHIGGTVGYIPPERLERKEGPQGDIYSLGVVLHSFLLAEKPPPLTESAQKPFEAPEGLPPVQVEVLEFAYRMRSLNPNDRPTALEVVAFCRERLDDGPRLALWGPSMIPEYAPRSDDDRIGTTLHEWVPPQEEDPIPVATGFGMPVLLAAVLGASVLALGVGLLGGGAWVDQPEPLECAPIDCTEPTPNEVPVELPVQDTDAATSVPAFQHSRPAQPQPWPAEPEPEPTTPALGQVRLLGDVGTSAVLIQGRTRHRLNHVVAGTYDLLVTWDGEEAHAGTVTVAGGQELVLRCKQRFRRCVP